MFVLCTKNLLKKSNIKLAQQENFFFFLYYNTQFGTPLASMSSKKLRQSALTDSAKYKPIVTNKNILRWCALYELINSHNNRN